MDHHPASQRNPLLGPASHQRNGCTPIVLALGILAVFGMLGVVIAAIVLWFGPADSFGRPTALSYLFGFIAFGAVCFLGTIVAFLAVTLRRGRPIRHDGSVKPKETPPLVPPQIKVILQPELRGGSSGPKEPITGRVGTTREAPVADATATVGSALCRHGRRPGYCALCDMGEYKKMQGDWETD